MYAEGVFSSPLEVETWAHLAASKSHGIPHAAHESSRATQRVIREIRKFNFHFPNFSEFGGGFRGPRAGRSSVVVVRTVYSGVEMGGKPTSWLQRLALQIAAQLPEEPDDALAVLGLAEGLVIYLSGSPPPAPTPTSDDQSVLRFPNTPSRRANSKGNPSGFPK